MLIGVCGAAVREWLVLLFLGIKQLEMVLEKSLASYGFCCLHLSLLKESRDSSFNEIWEAQISHWCKPGYCNNWLTNQGVVFDSLCMREPCLCCRRMFKGQACLYPILRESEGKVICLCVHTQKNKAKYQGILSLKKNPKTLVIF